MSFTNSIYTPLRILNFASFLQYQRFVMPISFLFYLHNGLNFSDFILFQSIFNITCLIAKIPMGFLGDIFSKKYILIFSYFLFLLRVVLWIFFSGFWVILAGEVLYGLFKAFYRGNVDSYIYEWLKSNNAERKMLPRYGKLSFYTSLGSAVSCIAGVILYKFYGFKSILILELLMQILAVSLLFFLPNTKNTTQTTVKINYLKSVWVSISSLINDIRVNYYVYYSAMLTGLTGVFVWNFQPLLKASGAPIFLYGAVSFINQSLRGVGGLYAKNIVNKIGESRLVIIEYLAVIISFAMLLLGILVKKYVLAVIALIMISLMILLYVVFNIFTVTKIHDRACDDERATVSSTNTFFGDFASFAFLLIFKTCYDKIGLTNTLITFLVIFLILLFPGTYKSSQTILKG